MELIINGKRKNILINNNNQLSITTLIEILAINIKNSLIEVNQEIIEPTNYNSCFLQEGDHIEIVRFIGGG